MPEGQAWTSNHFAGEDPGHDAAHRTQSTGRSGITESEPHVREQQGYQVVAEQPYHVLNDPVLYPVIALGVVLTTVMLVHPIRIT